MDFVLWFRSIVEHTRCPLSGLSVCVIELARDRSSLEDLLVYFVVRVEPLFNGGVFLVLHVYCL